MKLLALLKCIHRSRLTDSWLKFTYAKYSHGCQFTKKKHRL